jgi:hypothetical protein
MSVLWLKEGQHSQAETPRTTHLHDQRDQLLKRRNRLHRLLPRPHIPIIPSATRSQRSGNSKDSLNVPCPCLILDRTLSIRRSIQRWVMKHQNDAVCCCVYVYPRNQQTNNTFDNGTYRFRYLPRLRGSQPDNSRVYSPEDGLLEVSTYPAK